MINNVTNTTHTTPTTGGTSAGAAAGTAAATDPLANENTFLQLLVAQLKNQDPNNPVDGTQFVTQLAQFSSLEQELAMRQDLDSINSTMQTNSGASSTTSSTGSTQTGSTTNSPNS